MYNMYNLVTGSYSRNLVAGSYSCDLVRYVLCNLV